MAVTPVLKRFEIRVLKNRALNDPAQVPAAGATIKFHKQGATVRVGVEVPDSSGLEEPIVVPVSVYHIGTVVVEDELQHGAKEAQILKIYSVDPVALTVSVFNDSGDAIVLDRGDRLICRTTETSAPLFLLDPSGMYDATSFTLTDDQGRAGGYVRALRFDYTVTGPGLIPAAYPDAEGSFVMR